MSAAYNISLTAGYFSTQLIWRVSENQFEVVNPSGTTYVPFTSTVSANQQFQATFDGVQYIVVLTWNLFDERYYVNIYNTSQVLIAAVPLVGSLSATPAPVPAPVLLSATVGNMEMFLSWTASIGATSYNLYWSTTPGAGTGGTLVPGLASLNYVLTGLTNGVIYYAVVTAVNASGESAISNQVSVTPTNVVTWLNSAGQAVQWQNNSSQNVNWTVS